jgi:hypothetical protein
MHPDLVGCFTAASSKKMRNYAQQLNCHYDLFSQIVLLLKKAMRQKTSCGSVQCLYVISEESAELETVTYDLRKSVAYLKL